MSSGILESRWIDVPEWVSEVEGGGLPQGFRAAGIPVGLKPTGDRDLAMVVCDADEVTSAIRFTASGALAAPVLVTRERCRLDALKAVVVNAGNANAATGSRGLDEAARVQGAAATVARTDPDRVAVCSTGVIGVQLDGRLIVRGLARLAGELRPDGEQDLAAAIRTTDAIDKHVTLEVQLSGGTVTLSAQAKGAGMIQPQFATMLCFVQTDAQLSAETADLLLGVCVKRSFDRISVDGQLSTNDTALLQCSGSSGVAVEPESEDERRFGLALDCLLRGLALRIVRDGEGARRVGRVVVRGGHAEAVERVGRAVANSPLVKTALYGGDPNWGRYAQAIGAALPGAQDGRLAFDLSIEGVQLATGGQGLDHDTADLAQRVARDEVEIWIGLPGDGHEAECFFSDLGHEYITINADYTT